MRVFRKLFISVISLLLLVVTFTTTTYAWFKINSSASVDGLDFTVIGGEGFKVSVDGEHYSNDLTRKQITQAILLHYDDRFAIKEEKLVYASSGIEVSEEEINKIIKERIQLLPRTSNDGIRLTDLYGATSQASEGSFVEFDVYFQTVSTDAEDTMKYDIYLSGEEITQLDGTKVAPTTISSASVTNVQLLANMNTSKGNLSAGDTIQVYSENAMRMSIEDTTSETPQATIYELTNEYDLGSYATDYNGEDEELKRLYYADCNAMFTYYNNLRPFNPIPREKLLEFENRPKTIRSLTEEELPKITTVESGSNAKLVTFRFWLEGWDADCFDGLDKSISVKLSFTSKKI